MNVTPIPAVVFMKDEIANSTELNGIFTLPHSLKLETDLAKYELIDTTVMGKDRTIVNSFDDKAIYQNQRNNAWNAIATYYSLNALDLYRNSIVKLISNYIPDQRMVLNLYTNPEGVYNIVKMFICPDNDIYARPLNEEHSNMIAWDWYMDCYMSSNPNDDSFKKAFLRFEQAADSIIQLFTIYYVNYINNIVDYLASKGSLEHTYANLRRIVYGQEPPIKDQPDFYTVVTFVTSILREVAEQELQLIRNGLSMLSSNATFMLAKQIHTIDMGQFEPGGFPQKDAADFLEAIEDVNIEEANNNGNEKE